MDELSIVSGFTKGIVSKLLRMVIRKKLDCDVELQLHDLRIAIQDGKARLHVDLDAELEKEELMKLLKKIGV